MILEEEQMVTAGASLARLSNERGFSIVPLYLKIEHLILMQIG